MHFRTCGFYMSRTSRSTTLTMSWRGWQTSTLKLKQCPLIKFCKKWGWLVQTYRIEFRKQALKFIKSRVPKEQKRLLTEISKLPSCNNVKKLEGYDNRYRLRVGDVRIIYDKLDSVLVILVVRIGGRGDVYK